MAEWKPPSEARVRMLDRLGLSEEQYVALQNPVEEQELIDF